MADPLVVSELAPWHERLEDRRRRAGLSEALPGLSVGRQPAGNPAITGTGSGLSPTIGLTAYTTYTTLPTRSVMERR